jgi:phytoene dehydrogenase-like protein
MSTAEVTYDAIVVGGGHNGLVAACYLAKAKKRVLVLEAESQLGGATASDRLFPEYDAYISRYSYLVSLLPDQITSDLGLNFQTITRAISSYTPHRGNSKHDGLLVTDPWNHESESSFERLTGSRISARSWRQFYSELATLAQRLAPSLLLPLQSAESLKTELALPDIWDRLLREPIGNIVLDYFGHDLLRGIALTDAVIGTFASVEDMRANACFLYHLIGNGTGQWRVPKGGMGRLVLELQRVAVQHGVEIRRDAKVVDLETGINGVGVKTALGHRYTGRDLLFAAAPCHLAKLRGVDPPSVMEGSQLKINMLVKQLPRFKSGINPEIAFAGTLHVNESATQLENAFQQANRSQLPQPLPLEIYCHTLTDTSILSDDLVARGFHTLTLFGLHTPASLFDDKPLQAASMAGQLALDSLNEYLEDPIESVLAECQNGSLAMEVVTPLDLEREISLPRGNIFHGELTLPLLDHGSARPKYPIWGSETDDPHIFIAGAGARRGGGVSGIAGHNAAMSLLQRG